MSTIATRIEELRKVIPPHVTLVAVSKTKPAEQIMEAYHTGQRIFGENYVQELVEKQAQLPADIQWHFIGHLQSNKVKFITPFVTFIHGVSNAKLLSEINKHALKHERVIRCLLQVHIATEDTKFGFLPDELLAFCKDADNLEYSNLKICGLMGMATFTENTEQIRGEFRILKKLYAQLKSSAFANKDDFRELSIGMSGDWTIAVEEGSTMVRIGSAIFGSR